MAGIANLLDFADLVCGITNRRHPYHQSGADDPGGLGTQSADGDVAGQVRRRVVGAETHGRGLSVPRGHLDAPALADHFRGVGFRPRRARQHQPFLTAAAGRGTTLTPFAALSPKLLSRTAGDGGPSAPAGWWVRVGQL